MDVRQREVVELQSQVKALGQEVKDTDEVDGRRRVVEKKFQELLEPLRRRRNFLVASREVHQFNRDVEDELVRAQTDSSSRGLQLIPPPTCSFHGSNHEGAFSPVSFLPAALGPGEDASGHIH